MGFEEDMLALLRKIKERKGWKGHENLKRREAFTSKLKKS